MHQMDCDLLALPPSAGGSAQQPGTADRAGPLGTLVLYALAVLTGLAAAAVVMPWPAILGTGPAWHPPGPDQAQALTGQLAFQADAWRWPLLDTQLLFWPHGISIALTDSNPLLSLVAKLWTHATGGAPVNLFGFFMAACWLLQPVAAVYAARGLRLRVPASLAAGVLAAAWPALMARMGHLNLCAHFEILFALGLTLRRIERPGGWAAPMGLLVLAVLTQPYLFQLCAVLLAAIPLDAYLRRRERWRRDLALYVLSGIVAVAVFRILSGPVNGGDKGFVFFSMNLLSPFWPQRSGVFGADLPVIDATGGQYEGYNWLGAGVMLLLLGGLAAAVWRRAWPRPATGLALILAALAAMSLSSRIFAGHILLLDLGAKPWEDIFGSFRAPGRAFWPVGYALMLAGVAAADRLRGRLGVPLLLVACLLQLADIRPLLAEGRGFWRTGAQIATPPVPAGTTLFTVAPFPGCAPDPATKARGPEMLLDAVRHGARTGDVGLGRSPRWFGCERVLTDALELPLLEGETRAIFDAAPQAALRPALLGPDAACARMGDIVLCGRDVALTGGTPIPPGAPPRPAVLPLSLEGRAMRDVLGSGWVVTPAGEAWSEGPRGTLLIPVPRDQALVLTLRAAGLALEKNGTRGVTPSFGRMVGDTFTLPDERVTDVVLAVPAAATVDGMLRVALDVEGRGLDPLRRRMAAPVRRAAIRLSGLSVRAR
jgi:hypothetical protein